jgi:ParB-like chromosome segregation protein Spo0J
MNIVKRKLADLRKPERNVRMHTEKQLREFRRSIEMFDQIRPIVIDEGNVILAGNGLYQTLVAMGRAEAACHVVKGLSVAQKKKLMLADNRVFDLGVDDLAIFDEFIAELKDDLDIPGFDEDLLKSLVMEPDDVTNTINEYGKLEPEQRDTIQATHERYEHQSEHPNLSAGGVPSPSSAVAGGDDDQDEETTPTRRSVICPHCGETIWL